MILSWYDCFNTLQRLAKDELEPLCHRTCSIVVSLAVLQWRSISLLTSGRITCLE